MRNKTTIINSRNKKTFLSRACAHPQRHKNVIQPATLAPAKERAGLGSEVADLCAAPPPPTREASSSIISTRSPCNNKIVCLEKLYLYPQFVYVISTRSPVKKKKREKCKLKECVFIPAIYVCHFHPLALHPSYSWYVACTHYLRDARAERGKGSGWENRGWGGGGRQQGDRGRSANTSVDIKITLPAQSAWCLGEGPEAFSCLCFQT